MFKMNTTLVPILTDDEFPIYRAYPTNEEEIVIREFILQLKLGKVDLEYFKKKFNTDISKKFMNTLNELQDKEFLLYNEETIEMSRDGLLQVDMLLHEFFLKEHQNARYA